jgi:hypothetical protein
VSFLGRGTRKDLAPTTSRGQVRCGTSAASDLIPFRTWNLRTSLEERPDVVLRKTPTRSRRKPCPSWRLPREYAHQTARLPRLAPVGECSYPVLQHISREIHPCRKFLRASTLVLQPLSVWNWFGWAIRGECLRRANLSGHNGDCYRQMLHRFSFSRASQTARDGQAQCLGYGPL